MISIASLLNFFKVKFPWIVLESGRGIPPSVKKMYNEKFISFSVLERAFRNGRVGKIGLTQALMELTRRSEIQWIKIVLK